MSLLHLVAECYDLAQLCYAFESFGMGITLCDRPCMLLAALVLHMCWVSTVVSYGCACLCYAVLCML